MTTREIKGSRATVVLGEVDGGWAWHCHGCDARAGMVSGKRRPNREPFAAVASPFVDGEVNGVWRTGEEHAERSATTHANERCAGAATRAWKPPAYTEPTEG